MPSSIASSNLPTSRGERESRAKDLGLSAGISRIRVIEKEAIGARSIVLRNNPQKVAAPNQIVKEDMKTDAGLHVEMKSPPQVPGRYIQHHAVKQVEGKA